MAKTETRTIVINGSNQRRLEATVSFTELRECMNTTTLDHYATLTVTDIPEGKALQVDSYVVNMCKAYEARLISDKAEYYLFVKPIQDAKKVS